MTTPLTASTDGHSGETDRSVSERSRSRRRVAAMAVAAVLVPPALIVAAWLVFAGLVTATRIVMWLPGLGNRPRAGFLAVVAILVIVPLAAPRSRERISGCISWLRTAWSEPLDGGPGRFRHPLALGAGAGCVVTIVMLHSPVLGRMATHYHARGDSDQQIGLIHAVSEAIRGGSIVPRHLHDVVAPMGFDLWATDGYATLYAGGLLAVLLSPLLAYNLLLVGATVFNTWAGARLGRLYTTSPAVIALAGISLATLPGLGSRYSGHLQLIWIGLAALLFRAGVLDSRSHVHALRLGVITAVATATSGYVATVGLVLYAVALLCGPRAVIRRAVLGHLALAGVIAFALASPLLLGRLAHDRAERAAGGSDAYAAVFELNRVQYAANLAEAVTPPPYGRFAVATDPSLRSTLGGTGLERWIYPGLLAVLALGAAVAVPGRARIGIAAGAVVSLVLAWGPYPHLLDRQLTLPGTTGEGFLPTAAFEFLPVASALRVPGRFGYGLAVVGAAAIGLVGRELLRRRPPVWLGVGAFAVCLGMLALNTRAFPVAAQPSPELRALLSVARDRAEEGDRILVAPADCSGSEVGQIHLQLYHRLPSVGCTAPYLALPWFSGMEPYYESTGLAGLRCRPDQLGWFRTPDFAPDHTLTRDAEIELRDELGVRFVLVDLGRAGTEVCARFAEHALPLLEPDVVADADGWWLVDLDLSD